MPARKTGRMKGGKAYRATQEAAARARDRSTSPGGPDLSNPRKMELWVDGVKTVAAFMGALEAGKLPKSHYSEAFHKAATEAKERISNSTSELLKDRKKRKVKQTRAARKTKRGPNRPRRQEGR